MTGATESLRDRYLMRGRRRWWRWLEPPSPLIRNRREPSYPPGAGNLYCGGAGAAVPGFVNIDIVCMPGVDVVADAERLPFRPDVFDLVECDAVLEHVRNPAAVVREIERVLCPGGYVHFVVPFCHPFHAYPSDYYRFTPEGLRELTKGLEMVASGWRTGPTATLLVFVLEYFKMWFPSRIWRIAAHFVLGWILFPLRYLDLLFFRAGRGEALGNHCYVWLRKPDQTGSTVSA